MAKERSKLVLFIVEGQSEMNALYPIMKNRFKPDQVMFHLYKGDLTVKNYGQSSPVKEIEKILNEVMHKYGLTRTDIREVIELTDTDGIFIPDEAVIFSEEASHILYTDDGVFTAYPESILERNGKRRKNLAVLTETHELKHGIPFRVYYLSRNLEHALYGISKGVSDNRKTDLAYEFSDRFGFNYRGLLRYLNQEGVTLGGNYSESWAEIQKGLESVRRHTNLQLVLEE